MFNTLKNLNFRVSQKKLYALKALWISITTSKPASNNQLTRQKLCLVLITLSKQRNFEQFQFKPYRKSV